MKEIIKLVNVKKTFHTKEQILLFENVNLSVSEGESVCISGPSGSGKSTVLNIMGLLEDATEGDVVIRGVNTKDITKNEKALLRRTFSFMLQVRNGTARYRKQVIA